MTAYHYKALSPKGTSHKGLIEADSERQARQLLRDQGLLPMELEAAQSKGPKATKNRLSNQELCLFTRQLATLVEAGIPIEEALQTLVDQSQQAKTRELIAAVRAKLLEGFGLAQALAEFPAAFPALYTATVASGEHSGRLDRILEKLADYQEQQQGTRQTIQKALIYPALMILVSTSIIAFLLAFVVPKMIAVFTDTGQPLPIMTEILIGMSAGLKSYGLLLLLSLGLLIFLFQRALQKTAFRYRVHGLLLKLPLLGTLLQLANLSRYIHSFSILFSAGVNVLETMKVSSSLIHNLPMRTAFDKAQLRVREGSSIYLALKETQYLNPMALHLIASGEKSGELASMMEHAAKQMDTEIRNWVETGLSLLEPLIILLMGAIVLFIVLATLLPIFTMEQLVG